MTRSGSPQADLSRKPVESAADLTTVQTIARPGDKEESELPSEPPVSVTGVAEHDFLRRGVDGYQARLPEFATDNDQNAFDQIDIFDFQV
jgi:hypothetical protein